MVTTVLRPPEIRRLWAVDTRAAVNAQSWVKASQLLLVGQDRLFGAPGQVKSYDQANPRPPAGRGPDAQAYPLTLYGVVAAVQVPLNQYDWPNPRGPGSRQADVAPYQSRLFYNYRDTPFAPADQPNPRLAVRTPFDAPQGATLLLSSAAAPPAMPPGQYDWPTPRGAQRQQPDQQDNWLTFYAPAIAAAPFAQLDWPNPRGAGRQQVDQQDSWLTFYATIVPSPFAQLDWPNPRGIGRQQVDQQDSWLTFYGATAAAAPFAQREWPNPRRATTVLTDWTVSLNLALAAAPQPLRQVDWPNPVARLRLVEGYTASRFLGLSGVAGPAPFAQRDWPLPAQRRWRPPELDVFQTPVRSQAAVSLVFPIRVEPRPPIPGLPFRGGPIALQGRPSISVPNEHGPIVVGPNPRRGTPTR